MHWNISAGMNIGEASMKFLMAIDHGWERIFVVSLRIWFVFELSHAYWNTVFLYLVEFCSLDTLEGRITHQTSYFVRE